MDTLTEGVGERVAVRVQYTYCHSYGDLGGYSDRGGHVQCVWLLFHMICHMMYVCVGETHVHGLYMYIPCVRVTMDVQMVLLQNTAALDIPHRARRMVQQCLACKRELEKINYTFESTE